MYLLVVKLNIFVIYTCASRVHDDNSYQVVVTCIQGATVFYLINLFLDGVDSCREFNNFLLLVNQSS